MEYQATYFEDDLIPLIITDLKKIEYKNDKLVISNFKQNKKTDE